MAVTGFVWRGVASVAGVNWKSRGHP